MTKRTRSIRCFAIAVGDEPPREFRLFKAGANETTKGSFLFDEQAASAVMAAYAKHGADVMVDLEHLSLRASSPAYDPDARGWLQLEVRGGELWAVNVTWTPDGAARLSDRRQRYISPAFDIDAEGRIVAITNIAITALPATHDPTAVAASEGKPSMTLEEMIKVAEALDLGPDATLDEFLAKIGAMKGAAPEKPADKPADKPAGDKPPAAANDAPPGEEDKPEPEMMAAARMALSISGKATPAEAMAELERRSRVALDLEAREAKLGRDRATLETRERDEICASMVSQGGMRPAVVWADPLEATDPAKRKPAAVFANMSIEGLRDFAAKLGVKSDTPPAGNGGGAPRPPAGSAGAARSFVIEGHTVELSALEVERTTTNAKANGADVDTALARYAAIKLRQGRTQPITFES